MSKNNHYPLASARRRIVSRVCDYLLLISINIGITFALTFFTLDASLTTILKDKGWLFSLMLLLANFIFIGMWWMYFVQIVYWTKGKTLFDRIFKLRLYWENKEHILHRLFNHEVLIVGGIFFANIVMALISFVFDNPLLFIINIFNMNNTKNTTDGIRIWASIMITLYVLSCIPLVGIVANTFMNSHTLTYLDTANELFVIYQIDITKASKLEPQSDMHVLPGDIDLDELEKLK